VKTSSARPELELIKMQLGGKRTDRHWNANSSCHLCHSVSIAFSSHAREKVQ
jgi:hypothetical protein